jgi:hypothetical protein
MKKVFNVLAEKVNNLRHSILNRVPYKLVFIVTGLLATIWFLLRVIPKPSRAGYPCMRAAAPLMSGFVIYLLTFSSSFFAFRKARHLIGKRSFAGAFTLIIIGLLAGSAFFLLHNDKPAYANIMVVNEPPDGSNNPMGEGQGIFPGRVTWAWNPDATNADCTNIPGNSFWDYKNNDTLIIRNMVDESVIHLTGAKSFQAGWDSIFRYQNSRKHGEARGFQPHETIFIKINQGTASWTLTPQEKENGFAWPASGGLGAINPSWRRGHYATTETGPFVVLNILRHLVNHAGVPQENIAIGDPMAHIFYHNYSVWYNEFPNVQYVDKTTSNHKRTRITAAGEPAMTYSDDGEVLGEIFEYYFTKMEEADYMINVACLKSHIRGGITLCSKNHFGSLTRPGAAHLHPSLISTSSGGLDQNNTGYEKYRVLVDIMGHKYLGANTMLFIVEGLYGGSESEVRPPRKWNMEPFNGHWTSSIFMSLDQVALESVCYDFLREEFNGVNQPEDYPNWYGVDDYLHQAADKANWPEGFTYNPDGEGPIPSLGVHEHWNNPVDKQYSINLGKSSGIELVKLHGNPVSVPSLALENNLQVQAFPNPFADQLHIAYELTEPGKATIRLIDLQGRVVEHLQNSSMPAGQHQLTWNTTGKDLQQGIYILQLQVSGPSGNVSKSIRLQSIN